MEAAGFMFFSTIETFSWYVLSVSLFRFKIKDYFWQALVIIILMNLQSFILRNELSLANLVPIISIVLFIIFYKAVAKIPLLGAIVLTVSGFAIFAVVQTVLVYLIFGSVSEAQSTLTNGYILQFVTAAIIIPVSIILYSFGYGFTFDFDRLRFKLEHIVFVAMIIVFLVIVTYILYYNEIWINIAVFACSMAFLIRYAIRKDSQI